MKISMHRVSYLLLIIGLMALSGTSCKKENRAAPMPVGIQNYVYAFTTGIISKSSDIKVRFTSDVVDKEQVGKAIETKLISFNPMLKGKAVWENTSTLRFEPAPLMESGTAYVATVSLRDIFDNVPKAAEVFQFDFKTKEQGFQVNFSGLQAASIGNIKQQILTGTVLTEDVAVSEQVEKILTAQQEGRELAIEWIHLSQFEYQFQIKGITRTESASEVKVNWNGAAIEDDKKGSRTIEIPAIGDFKVIDAIVLRQGAVPSIQLNFSDPLLADQDLEGLIRINNFNGSIDFSVNENQVTLFPKGNLSGEKTIEVSAGIKNIDEVKMQKPSVWTVRIEAIKPQVRLVRQGVIIPNTDGLVLPFEAVSLNAVEVEVFKIFNNNILQFLQNNELDGQGNLYQVGRIILQEKVPLKNLNPQANSFSWSKYALDLSKLFQADPNAIYQVRIGFRPEYAVYGCTQSPNFVTQPVANRLAETEEAFQSIWNGWYGINGYYDGYRYEHREDPCEPAYYNYRRFVKTNVIASDLGIMAKGGTDKRYFVAVTNLLSTEPIGNVAVSFYDYQQQLIKTVQTDNAGIAEALLSRKPFAIIAENGLQKGYLKVGDGNSLSLSRYDVSGAVAQKGMKGLIYGERGVWRPGDSLFLNFIIESKSQQLPNNHPVTFELRDPRGQVAEKQMLIRKVDNVYPIHVKTAPDAPTGNWMASIKVGGATFTKVLKIETVKPNRLKVNLDFPAKELTVKDMPANVEMQVNWLHGAAGQNLTAKVEMQVSTINTKFENYKQYEFDDPSRSLYANPQTVFDGKVDADGKANFAINAFVNNRNAPGKVMAKFKCRAFEKGGDFSTYNTNVKYSPYPNYVGINLPRDAQNSKRIAVDKDGTIRFILLDDNGNPIRNANLEVGLYRLNWRWWWDRGQDNISHFNSSNHHNARRTATLTTNERGEATWTVQPNEWGRYMVRVCDSTGGHCSGDYFYSGYPWYNRDGNINKQEAAMMAFVSDKQKYEVDEEIELKIPASEDSRMLVTLENGTKVLDSFWGAAKKGENKVTFKATAAMAPTIYAHVTLLQPHGQVENDLPIRMYGVIPVSVENPKTILKPVLKMPEELAPNQTFTVKVSEQNDEPMAYTIAVVDDGLLDLTNFKTPTPHQSFYAREALGVRTWDIYDHVLGAYGGALERVLSIGGDGELGASAEKKNANRFKPVVRHLGPFYLNSGKTAEHKITMPNYVGSVRTMVVAANSNAAYGHTEKTTPVKKPLMLLATLPRVLGPGETLRMPVNLFAMDDKIKDVSVTVVEATGLVEFPNGSQANLVFEKPSDKMAYIDLKVAEKIGIAKFKISAKGGGAQASQEIEMDIRNPNPYVTNVQNKWLDAGQSWETAFEVAGMTGTNTGILEVSNIPPINLEQRLKYLIRYPHGCIEQTTSAAFPQLFVNNLITLNDERIAEINQNIKDAIQRINRFQTPEGGFAYWPGNEDNSTWGTNYAGHFLLEAKAKGYALPFNLLENWLTFQRKRARNWSGKPNDDRYNYQYSSLTQAYRLYTLAKAGQPELGAMNRLREVKNLPLPAKWRLAAAYALVGKVTIAKDIYNNLSQEVEDYRELGYTYGSDLRDEAMILETLVICGDQQKGTGLIKNISDALSTQNWYSTQTTAYCLMAISKFIGTDVFNDELAFAVKIGEKEMVNAGSKEPIMQIQIEVDKLQEQKIQLKNTTNGKLFARLILSGQPVTGDQSSKAENLKMEVTYVAMNGEKIDPVHISQGTDFIAEVRITHPGIKNIRYDEMALTQIFPSGWEIMNTRMENFSTIKKANRPEYQDIRDDRIYSYFDIRRNNTLTYKVQLNAAYQGRYYLPTVACSAMYDNTINARVPGQWVEIVQ